MLQSAARLSAVVMLFSCLVLTCPLLTCSVFEAELADHIPVVKTSVAGTRLVGRVTVGMH